MYKCLGVEVGGQLAGIPSAGSAGIGSFLPPGAQTTAIRLGGKQQTSLLSEPCH